MNITRFCLITLGLICVGLGILGVFLPILPTTPFMLLALGLFARSSDRLHKWLLNHRVFGKTLRDYKKNKAISKRAKIVSLTAIWATMIFSIFFVVNNLIYVQLLLALIAISLNVFILSLKTAKP